MSALIDTTPRIVRDPFEEFIENVLAKSQPKSERKARWKQRASLRGKSILCETCGADLTSVDHTKRFASPIVPRAVGGPASPDNFMLLCVVCSRLRGKADIIDPVFTSRLSAPLPAALLEKRAELLLHGFNHLTPLRSMAPREKVSAVLSERHTHPRFRVFVHLSFAGFFVAFRRQSVEPQSYAGAGALLRHVYGADVSERDGLVIFRGKTRTALDALWALIELNGLCVPVDLTRSACDAYPIFPTDWRICWREIYSRLSDNRRRYRTRQHPVPSAPKPLCERTRRRHLASGEARRRANRRALEVAHSNELWERVERWTNPQNEGYRFRPEWDVVKYTMACSVYWRHSEEGRRLFLWRHPDFKVPEL